jgi:DtxR family Mn-dependent transcriptional regulator
MQNISRDDYLKLIYKLSENTRESILTGDIAQAMDVNAASVSDMLKKLSLSGMISYVPYQGVKLSRKGRKHAMQLVRRHRLWESFLVNHLGMHWNQVHEIAEQLEHVSSETLISKLDAFLGSPDYDPHGDPIPDGNGVMPQRQCMNLQDAKLGQELMVARVMDDSPVFLESFDALSIKLGDTFSVCHVNAFDGLLTLQREDLSRVYMSRDMASRIECSPVVSQTSKHVG